MTYLVTFYTNFDANAFMKKVKTIGKARMKPVPRSLSSSCGTCIEFTPEDSDFPIESLSDMEYEGFYLVMAEDYRLLYHKD